MIEFEEVIYKCRNCGREFWTTTPSKLCGHCGSIYTEGEFKGRSDAFSKIMTQLKKRYEESLTSPDDGCLKGLGRAIDIVDSLREPKERGRS